MKVLHLWDNYAPGLFDLTHQICIDRKLDSRLLCLNFINRNGSANLGQVEAIKRISLDKNLGVSIAHRTWNRFAMVQSSVKFRRRAKQIVRDWNPDAVHIHFGTTAARLSAEDEIFCGRRCIISFYGFDISQALRSSEIVSAYRRIMRYEPLTHVLCDAARDRILALGGRREQIVVANLPVAVERYGAIPIVAPTSIKRWLIPARFVQKKGHAVAILAFQKFLDVFPDAKLTCWGYGDARWLNALVKQAGLQRCVEIFDNAVEPDFDRAYERILAEHDAVLVPSVVSIDGDDEGGPALTAVIAQAAGKPLICSDFAGSERSVINGVEGFVVAQNDPIALSHAMLRLASDATRATTMGEAGRARVVREFSRATFERELLGWYGGSST